MSASIDGIEVDGINAQSKEQADRSTRMVVMMVGTETVRDMGQLEHARGVLEERILKLTGGFSVSEVDGVWRSPFGEVFKEVSLRYEIVTDKDCRDLAALARHEFVQECVLLAEHEVKAEFV